MEVRYYPKQEEQIRLEDHPELFGSEEIYDVIFELHADLKETFSKTIEMQLLEYLNGEYLKTLSDVYSFSDKDVAILNDISAKSISTINNGYLIEYNAKLHIWRWLG